MTFMDIDVIREYLEASPNILFDIKNIQNYRDLRTQQAFYSRLCYEYDYPNFLKQPQIVKDAGAMDRDYWKEQSISLDRKRRDCHNLALSSFYNILEVGRKHNLDYIYLGPELTGDEAFKYLHSERRAEVTDAMLELLYTIEDSVIPSQEKNAGLHDIKREMNAFNRNYHVKKSLTKDESKDEDGNVQFDLKSKNNTTNIENL